MKHHILDQHQVIAWDVDGTLVNGINSDAFRKYIIATPHKQHHIVTFRDEVWAQDVYEELAEHGVPRSSIASIASNPTGKPHVGDSVKLFKGAAARKVGATIMIDDMPEMVEEGCQAAGVVFMDARLFTSRPSPADTLP